ncbi:hypothetical protein DTW90_27300 [Neorhizobium sp. P12A]|nr:hypothetical protein DTW90_27300 [Neorhizobium sp. P12A]
MQQCRAGGGQEHAVRLALEQLDVEIEFQVSKALADCRGRKMFALSGLSQARFFSHSDEETKCNQIDTRQMALPQSDVPRALH